MITALERGGLSDWHRMGEAIRADPWGPVARRVETALTCVQPYGVDVAMRRILSHEPPGTWPNERPLRRKSYRSCGLPV